MTQYALGTSNFQPGQVGTLYSVGISNGSTSYGYIFQNQGLQSAGIVETTNVADKEKLIQFSSPNLIDRDFAYYPRVTQGDTSGGGLQTVFLEPTKYFDSDLEIRTPGYLTLRPGWKRTQLATSLGAVTPQSVPWKGDVYTTFQGTSYYNSSGTSSSPGITAKFLATDGWNLFIGDGTNGIKYTVDGTTFTDQSTTSGAFAQMWSVLQGTGGRFLYLARTINSNGSALFQNLYKLDTSIIPNNSPALVPTGSIPITVMDVVPYQSAVAILTKDPQGSGSDAWFHDGANMTRIVRLEQYNVVGMVNCLGSLYVTATSFGQFEAPVLIRIDAGSFQVVARPASPLISLTSAGIGSPAASGQYVYFTLSSPQINNITTTSYVGVYDVVSGAFSHLGNLDSNDAPPTSGARQIAPAGRSVAFPMISSGTGYIQYQTNNNLLASGTTYATSGTLVGSSLDFGTPGIPKRFRREELIHPPLATGESVTVKGFVDLDPLNYTSSLTPTATVTNSVVGSTLTALTFGADVVGRTLYDAVVLGGNGTSSPRIQRRSVEIGGTYTWEFDFDCSSKRRTLQQQMEDAQGVNGKDLYFLLRNAYENGTLLTLYLAGGVSYTVTIENLKATSPSYSDHLQSTVKADQEWFVHAILHQVA